ncbi:PEBP-like protein [Laetiporus sulphureus 93-53]|uniref:PEBP-like protein n=1 Tax=Laetiporus sulphureus 93-53 TaxID=1314785 RepID=A0A165ECB2_9APHY|nr:PEBP-like protein [Laetiporus sulphureus 93-53]KZT06717.1 PEBP-like protein [Laetiporus sulphureus 93-53]
MDHLDPLSSLVSALKRDHIIPDVLPESFNPSVLLSVEYPNEQQVLIGNQLTVEDTTEEPAVSFVPMNLPFEKADNTGEDVGEEATYTLVMVDPDAPSRKDPKFKCFRHWVLTGLKSPAHSASTTADPQALKTKASTTPYRPPGPRPGSGQHRYIFLLYQEPASSEPLAIPQGAAEHESTLEERRSWDPIAFGDKYGLRLVGATYFLVNAAGAEE